MKLALSDSIRNEAIDVARKITSAGGLQGRMPSVIAAGIIYLLLQKHILYRSPDRIADAANIATESIYSIRKVLTRWV